MRVVVGQVIKVIQRYPALVDGAFVIIAWVGLKLLLDYGHQLNWISWEVAQPVSLGIISVIMAAAYAYARKTGPKVSKEPPEENT